MKSSIHCSKWHALATFGATDLLLLFNIGHVDTKLELNTTKSLQCYVTISLTTNATGSFLAWLMFWQHQKRLPNVSSSWETLHPAFMPQWHSGGDLALWALI
jgi:hypothetical protein